MPSDCWPSPGHFETTGAVGLSSLSRLYDLFVKLEGTPVNTSALVKVSISYGFHPSPFGECLLGVTERGICHLSFVLRGGRPVCASARTWQFILRKMSLTGKLVAEAFAGGDSSYS